MTKDNVRNFRQDPHDEEDFPRDDPRMMELAEVILLLEQMPDDAFELVNDNYNRYKKVCALIRKIALYHDGRSVIPRAIPQELNASGELNLPLLFMNGSDTRDLRDLIDLCDMVEIYPKTDGTVSLDFTVSTVYKLREA